MTMTTSGGLGLYPLGHPAPCQWPLHVRQCRRCSLIICGSCGNLAAFHRCGCVRHSDVTCIVHLEAPGGGEKFWCYHSQVPLKVTRLKVTRYGAHAIVSTLVTVEDNMSNEQEPLWYREPTQPVFARRRKDAGSMLKKKSTDVATGGKGASEYGNIIGMSVSDAWAKLRQFTHPK